MIPFYFIILLKNCEEYAGGTILSRQFPEGTVRTNEILQTDHPAAGLYLKSVLTECESDA